MMERNKSKRDETIRKRQTHAALPVLETDYYLQGGNAALNGSRSLWPWGAPSPEPVLIRLKQPTEQCREREGKIREAPPFPTQKEQAPTQKVPRFPHPMTARANQHGCREQASGLKATKRESRCRPEQNAAQALCVYGGYSCIRYTCSRVRINDVLLFLLLTIVTFLWKYARTRCLQASVATTTFCFFNCKVKDLSYVTPYAAFLLPST